MLRKLIRKKHFRALLDQLRGAKILREKDTPFYVLDVVSSLTDVPLGLKKNDFPKILVRTHAPKAEILLRQILLRYYSTICSAVMKNIGSGKPVSILIPPTWREYLTDNGITFSATKCNILLFFSSLRQIAAGFVKSLILLFPFNKPSYPGCPYVAFVHLYQQNLPIPGDKKSYDIISWYKESIIRKPNIGKVWAEAKVGKGYVAPDDLVVARSIFPKLGSFSGYVRFIFSNTLALFVAIFGVFMGKWWYGFLYAESVLFNYLNSLNTDELADEYFFSNSSWIYKPLWANEAERRGKSISLYSYSVNMDYIFRDEQKDTYGCNIMLWNHFIVWDKQQEYFWKKYCPKAVFSTVGFINNGGLTYNHFPKKEKYILSIFDVTPMRPSFYTSRGYGVPSYSEEMNISFLKDIISVFSDGNWEILWKQKREVDNNFISNNFIRKRLNLIDDRMIKVDSNVAATSLVEVSDAVISMPFSSPSVIAKVKGVNSVFYDTSEGYHTANERGGIPILKSKLELNKWFKSLSVNHTVDSCD